MVEKATTPYIEFNLAKLRQIYGDYASYFHNYSIYYAVKANPHAAVIDFLASQNCSFDTASIEEIQAVLAAKVDPSKISYGNVIKKARDIAQAYQLGVRLYATDSFADLENIAKYAANSEIFCRILTESKTAQWPLSRKFGCDSKMALQILLRAKELGLRPRGISFHVGSQQLSLEAWNDALSAVAEIFTQAEQAGLALDLINLGGGFPICYTENVPSIAEIANYITSIIEQKFAHYPRRLQLIIEPGRGLVGSCGILCTEIILITPKDSRQNSPAWLYIDAGKFNGLIETLDEAIRYNITAPSHRKGELIDYIIAGPTCDSADILYEKLPYKLPNDLQVGDILIFHGTGAYSSSYASVCFNGFPPIATHIT